MTKKIEILVACHKQASVFSNDVYRPIQVGKANHKEKFFDLTDDTGDNISHLNPNFCELTAIYWAWKNLKDVEYVGLQHYRRYFETEFTDDNVDYLFTKCDVVLTKPLVSYYPLEHKIDRALSMEDYLIFKKVIRKVAPEYEETIARYLADHVDYPYNMFVCKKSVFDKYATWLFSILFECQKYIRVSPYTCSARVFGYIAEYLLPIYFIHNGYRIKTDYVVSMIGEKAVHSPIKDWAHLSLIKAMTVYRKAPSKFIIDDTGAEAVGLKNDGIII